MKRDFRFEITHQSNRLARVGQIHTPHGIIQTPAFIPVGTKATMKAVLPEQMTDMNAQALLANAYHLYLQPGADIVDQAGGLGKFMNWAGPTFTDSGGFQVMSLGKGFKKVISMDASFDASDTSKIIARPSSRLAHVTEDGVQFKSHLNGSLHFFTPELSIQIQHQLGADIMFTFDELTTLVDPYDYQIEALERTHAWAKRCLIEHQKQTKKRANKPYQALFAVLQGANYEDLRRQTAQFLGGQDFDGFGIGGAIEKDRLGEIVAWVCEELPAEKPRHLLGISEPDDIFSGIENGADTFDCVSPARRGRNGSIYTLDGMINVNNARFKTDFTPLVEYCDCYTCAHYTRAYLHHLFKAHERNSATLATIHNERFIIKLVDDIRASLLDDSLERLKSSWLKRFYKNSR